MIKTARRPSIGEILVEEFLEPLELTQEKLAEVSGLTRKHINELCRDKRAITASTALILERVFGVEADFWLNLQRHVDMWEALNSPKERERIERAKPLEHRASM